MYYLLKLPSYSLKVFPQICLWTLPQVLSVNVLNICCMFVIVFFFYYTCAYLYLKCNPFCMFDVPFWSISFVLLLFVFSNPTSYSSRPPLLLRTLPQVLSPAPGTSLSSTSPCLGLCDWSPAWKSIQICLSGTADRLLTGTVMQAAMR